MKYTVSAVLILLFIVGCANWGGNNPLGVTGGSENGYGKNQDLNLPTSNGGGSQNLIGTWRSDTGADDYEIIIFNSNGTYDVRIYEDGIFQFGLSGSYTVSGNQITLEYEGEFIVLFYTLSDDRLILNGVTYYRD